jgi:hypothetical protein
MPTSLLQRTGFAVKGASTTPAFSSTRVWVLEPTEAERRADSVRSPEWEKKTRSSSCGELHERRARKPGELRKVGRAEGGTQT